MKNKVLMLILLPAFLLTACNKDDDDEMMMSDTKDMIKIEIANLAASADGEQYEGWIIVDGNPVSTGTFRIDESGNYTQSEFSVDPEKLASASDFVLTIEPMPDDDPAPSAIKILGGSFSGNSASVSVAHPAALGHNFSSVTGKFILATPTTSTMDDELSGIWFLQLVDGSPMPALELPDLPSGWVYEGWAVINGQPVTSGRFTSVSAADESAPFSGSDASGPPFPGEDYVTNAPADLSFPTDLSESTLVISIEPEPDNSPAPFAFKPLVGPVPANASDHTNYDMMSNVSGSFPSGSVSKK